MANGRFGPYVHVGKTYASLPNDVDPMTITQEEAVELIRAKREAEARRHLKRFPEEPELEILSGRFGPYICYKGSNYKIPKDIEPQDLTLEACLKLVEIQADKDKSQSKPKRGRYAKKRK